MTTLRNLLLVTYQFPPIGGSGVQRAVKLARYLPRAGWRAHVLSAGHTHYPLLDPMLVHDVGEAVPVHRVCGLEPASMAQAICRHVAGGTGTPSWLNAFEDRLYWRLDRACGRLQLPETEMLWVPAAIRKARDIIDRHAVEAVVTTSPPHSAHLVGLFLKRRLGVPWIADLRDPILDNFAYRPTTRWADRFWQWLERSVLLRSSHTVVTCPELADRFLERYPRLDAGRLSTITNGFDPADRPAPPLNGEGESRGSRRFTISYIGAFYRDQTIAPILDAIRRLRASRRDIATDLEFRLVGSLSASQRQFVRCEDEAFFNNLGYRQHDEALAEMARADVLLLATPASEGGRLCIPAKTFEYLAFGGHILALVHEGTALAAILAEAGNVSLLHQQDPAAVARVIERCYDAWRAGTLETPRDQAVVGRFRREGLADRLARIVERCAEGPPHLRVVRDDPIAEEAAA